MFGDQGRDFTCTGTGLEEFICPLCFNNIFEGRDSVRTDCGHYFCVVCYSRQTTDQKEAECPICRQSVEAVWLHAKNSLYDQSPESPSRKIAIRRNISYTHDYDPNDREVKAALASLNGEVASCFDIVHDVAWEKKGFIIEAT